MSSTPLSSHTAKSFVGELAGGRAVITTTGREFRVSSAAARRILSWYNVRRDKWERNVQKEDVEAIVNVAIVDTPNSAPTYTPLSLANVSRQLHVVTVRAHRFAGLHGYEDQLGQPDDFVLELDKRLTLIQGRNGSGKTSLINAITWCLTGYVNRPQRQPEKTEVPLEIEPADEGGSTADISVISPIPPPDVLEDGTDRDRVAVETWVELTLADNEGTIVGNIRRAVTRSVRGKLTEEFRDGGLELEPIAYEIGSRMPGLIPYIQLGAKSDFGVAVSMLTGLRPVQQLAQHAVRVRTRLRGEFAKTRAKNIEAKTAALQQKRLQFQQLVRDQRNVIALDPEVDVSTRIGIASARTTLESQQTQILSAASVLGPTSDLTSPDTRQDLLRSVEPAIDAISIKKLRGLRSAAVMVDLYKLTDGELSVAETLLQSIAEDAEVLAAVHDDPVLSSRLRLYARVAGWLHDERQSVTDHCPVCGSSLRSALDPHTSKPVTQHLQECFDRDADALQKTVAGWEVGAVQRLRSDLPPGMTRHLDEDLLDSPHETLRKALTHELFANDCFKGALAHLKVEIAATCQREIHTLPEYQAPQLRLYPRSLGQLGKLRPLVEKVAKLIAFARWRRQYDAAWRSVFASTVGNVGSTKGESIRQESGPTLAAALLALRKQIEAADPLTRALDLLTNLDEIAKDIDTERQRLADSEAAAVALDEIAILHDVVREEIEALLETLMQRTKQWKESLYRHATAAAPRLIGANVNDVGAMSMSVALNGTSAPAHAVANASDLRANLLGFLFAFWEHIWKTRGGLSLMLLDDIQELFDRDNRRRVAAAIPRLVREGARILCTTNDVQFAREMACAGVPDLSANGIGRHLLHAVSSVRRSAALGIFEEDVDQKRREFEHSENENMVAPAVAYVENVRVHAEQRLLDLFDDVVGVPLLTKPTLSTLRDEARGRINRGVEPFSLPAVRAFVEDPSLQQGNPVLDLLNQCHHAGRVTVTFGDVSAVGDELSRLRERAEAAFDAYQRWLRRDEQAVSGPVLVAMPRPMTVPLLDVQVLWELAAFTSDLESFGHPVKDGGRILSAWFGNKAAYRVRSSALGFSCPRGSLAIVDLSADDIEDSRLVIALRGRGVFARRFLRNGDDRTYVALGSEEPNPLKRAPSLFMRADQVKLLKIVGVLFDQPALFARGNTEAYEDDASALVASIESAFRVDGESALPLALPGQVVLGGAMIVPGDLPTLHDVIVAVQTTAGALLKRVAGTDVEDGTILLDAIGGMGGSIVARLDPAKGSSRLPVIKKARRVVGILYDV
jgi:energy-coupling factor transporter ATP-binding protein EcfA2